MWVLADETLTVGHYSEQRIVIQGHLEHLGTSLNTQWGVSTVSNVVGRTGSYFYTHTDSPETVLRV